MISLCNSNKKFLCRKQSQNSLPLTVLFTASLLVISCYGDIFSASSFHIFFHNIQLHALNIITPVCLPTSAESTTDGTTLQHHLVQIIEITKTQVLHKPTQSRTGRKPVSLVLRAYCNEDKQNLTHLVSLSTKDWLKGWYYIYHKKKTSST